METSRPRHPLYTEARGTLIPGSPSSPFSGTSTRWCLKMFKLSQQVVLLNIF